MHTYVPQQMAEPGPICTHLTAVLEDDETERDRGLPAPPAHAHTLANYFHNDFRLNSHRAVIHTGCHGASRVWLYEEMERTMEGKSSLRITTKL